MAEFKDAKDEVWEIKITTRTAADVKEALGFSIFDLLQPDKTWETEEDTIKLVDAMYVLCRRQATSRGIDDYGFAEVVAGDVYPEALTALLQAIIDFYPASRKSGLQKILDEAVVRATELDGQMQALSDSLDVSSIAPSFESATSLLEKSAE